MAKVASSPSRQEPLMGTPMTGSGVSAAMTPGRAAAMPAPAMMTRMPRPAALRAKSLTSAGVRWAERALTSKGISISSKNWQAFSMTGRSEVLPMIMLTIGVILGFLGVLNLEIAYPEAAGVMAATTAVGLLHDAAVPTQVHLPGSDHHFGFGVLVEDLVHEGGDGEF